MHGVHPRPNITPSSGEPAGKGEPVKGTDEQQAHQDDQAAEHPGQSFLVRLQREADAAEGDPIGCEERGEAQHEQRRAGHGGPASAASASVPTSVPAGVPAAPAVPADVTADAATCAAPVPVGDGSERLACLAAELSATAPDMPVT